MLITSGFIVLRVGKPLKRRQTLGDAQPDFHPGQSEYAIVQGGISNSKRARTGLLRTDDKPVSGSVGLFMAAWSPEHRADRPKRPNPTSFNGCPASTTCHESPG
ncbi:hypothetical protein EN820_51355 [bacterium M00.F.Ca.ET.177.01.1.1]|nr:hypothetical protein EN820_51355 [bacterium M00.F.Ca.ET.177.01.1.1]